MAVRVEPTTRSMMALCEEVDGILYPIEEAHVVQGNWHFQTVRDAVNMVESLLRDRPSAGLFSDILTYWEEGNPHKRWAPDLLVLPDIEDPERSRRVLHLWRERTPPVFVMEVLSDETAANDLHHKFRSYQDELRIPEYFLCDAREDERRVWGYRLEGRRYRAVPLDAGGRVWSAELRGWFGIDDDGGLRVWDRAGRPMLRHREATAQAWLEAQRAQDEARRRQDSEARVRELEAEIRRLRGEA